MKKAAIMTGGSWGIGFATARRLGSGGFSVMVFATIPKEANQERFDQLSAEGIEYHYARGNPGSPEDRQRLVQEAVDRFGGVHVPASSTGVAPEVHVDLLKMNKESFDFAVGVNTKGNMFLTQAVIEQMLHRPIEGEKRGIIVGVSSYSAEASSTNRGEYCISKVSMLVLTTSYTNRLAAEGTLVNEVRPGVVFTDMTPNVQEKYESLIEQGIFPIIRQGTLEDVANAVGVFCGDELLYTAGNCIDIDGGFHIKRL